MFAIAAAVVAVAVISTYMAANAALFEQKANNHLFL